MSDDEAEVHGTRKARETSSGSVDVRIPKEAMERAGIETDGQVLVASTDDGVVIRPWGEDDIRDLMGE
ncbi:hypothetical protein [Halarchaeum sp. P4]|uniref:hypothetical protein n=1 Tax=Halarchaeum sp. P4 TaxID=3421639 RepID=UPI003EB8B018